MLFKNKVISIDIGSNKIKIIEGMQIRNSVFVNNFATIVTPKDSYNDGRILNKDRIKNVLLNTIKEKKIKGKKAVFTIQSTSTITREIVLPKTKPDEMDNIIRYEIEQYLPIVLDDYVIQYKFIEEFKEENSKKLKIQVVALPKIIVEVYLEVIKELNLKPFALDINSNSVSKLFSKEVNINGENYSFDKTVAVIDLGHHFINVNIVKEGTSHFSRIITKGGKDIDLRLANSFNFSIDEAERKKINQYNNENIKDYSISSKLVDEVVTNSIYEWINEINRVFQYYISRKREFNIDMIYLHGGSCNLKDIENLLKDNLNIPVCKINNISSIKLGKKATDLIMSNYLNAIGAIIRE